MRAVIASRTLTCLVATMMFAGLALSFTMIPAQAGAADGAGAADVVGISCTGTSKTNYGPPIGPIPQEHEVTVRERLGTFANGAGQCDGPVAGGHAEATFHEEASCAAPSPAGTVIPPDVLVYQWDNGKSSTINFTVTTVTHAGGQTIVTSAGTVTDGFLEGAAAHREKIGVDFDVRECLEGGVEHQESRVRLTIG